MGTITGQSIIDSMRDLAKDTDKVRWPDAEVLRYLNEGIRDLCMRKPEAYVLRGAFALEATERQTIATIQRAHKILDVPFALDSTNLPVAGIRQVSADALTAVNPDWVLTTGDQVRHWIPDVEPHTFHVYPGKARTAGLVRKVEIVYAAIPPLMAALSAQLPIDDIYANAVGYYVLFRVYAKDEDGTAAPAAAQAYHTLYTNSLGA